MAASRILGSMRSTLLKGSALGGATVLGIAYYQRLPRNQGDHTSLWSERRSSRYYQTFAAPVIMLVDPETAHNLALAVGKALQAVRLLAEPAWTGATSIDWLLRPGSSAASACGPSLRQELFGGRLCFDSPLGIAAGFDKNAVLVPLYRLGAIPGLGFSEVGSVSDLPAEGNARPRCFRIPEDEAVINRMGLNNEGSAAVASRLKEFSALRRVQNCAPLGVNIAKTHNPDIMGEAAVGDFVNSFQALAPHADFMVLNVSCPNTAEGKTFEETDTLQRLLQAVSEVKSAASPPVFVKLSPPPDVPAGHDRLRELVGVAEASGIIDGYVISNTAGDRDLPLSSAARQAAEAIGRGGLSGRPLQERSTAAVRQVYQLTGGRVPIIGVGGVDSAEAAYAKIRAGASLVEVYTGIVYKGPTLFADMHVGLRRLLERDGFKSISEAVGVDARSV